MSLKEEVFYFFKCNFAAILYQNEWLNNIQNINRHTDKSYSSFLKKFYKNYIEIVESLYACKNLNLINALQRNKCV